MKDKISEIFNIEPISASNALTIIDNDTAEIITSKEEALEEDFALSRRVLRNSIVHAESAVANLATIARMSDSPKAYEILAQLLISTGALSKDLLSTHRNYSNASKRDNENAAKTINNNLFVGSTQALQKMLRDLNTEEEK